ncbi:hypothetical protein GCM10027278_04250 [Paralcaligenes ginsengisoli]
MACGTNAASLSHCRLCMAARESISACSAPGDAASEGKGAGAEGKIGSREACKDGGAVVALAVLSGSFAPAQPARPNESASHQLLRDSVRKVMPERFCFF